MSGHSKWSKVKHQKAVTDSVKAREFTRASRGITVAVKEAGGVSDPDKNFRLRLALEKARSVNMPKETIDRAMAKGKGEGGNSLTEALYEVFGPGGVAILIEVTTDNNNRVVSEIKNILDRNEGSLARPGAVVYLFSQKGSLEIPKVPNMSYDMMMEIGLEAGADDVVDDGQSFILYTSRDSLSSVKSVLEKRGIAITDSALIMKPKIAVGVADSISERVMKLLSAIDDLEDVQEVYTNIG